MQFREIIGQEAVKEQLLRSAREERVSHAQLFTGPEGSGALALAIAYAQYLSCEQPGEADSCGECPSCRKYGKLVHPDLHFSYPFIASKKESVALDYIGSWREALLEQRSEEHTSELQTLMRISYSGCCWKKTTRRTHSHK